MTEKPTLKTEIILGKDLTKGYIEMMNSQRVKEYGENTKDFKKNEQGSTFFFLKEMDGVKAFGMLKPVTLCYDDKPYQIMGIANVIAIEKSKGFGSLLMEQITKYIEENNMVVVGNTYVDNFEFYKKCGYRFVPGLLPRFVYKKENGEEARTETQNYEMFIFDPQNMLKNVIEGTKSVVIKVPFW
ncbi:GNAT family N-acetyltransferase [Candidatus Roizmanbacteria bacterium]|nr:GNAT family N-acetyltransferase [Candidatus Roizmanbacteria bacterium]